MSKRGEPAGSFATVEQETNENIECRGYKKNPFRTAISYICSVLTLGFLVLVFYWKEDWKLKCTCTLCDLEEADFVLIKDIYKRDHVSAIKRRPIKDTSRDSLQSILKRDVVDADWNLRFFKFQKIFYIWDPIQHSIFRLRGLEDATSCKSFFTDFQEGLTETISQERRDIYGKNEIYIRVRSIPLLLIQEILNPFYIFQIFSVSVWLTEEYYYYSGVIILMSVMSITLSLYTARKQSMTLRAMVESNTKVNVLRPNNNVIEVSEKSLVPGDVIVIPHNGCMMTCDAVLIAGNCIVNESSLTGESVPVTKTPLPRHDEDDNDGTSSSNIYSCVDHKRHTLFCGTKVIQTRSTDVNDVRAVVVQTGYSTAKGSLVLSILYPKPMEIRLHRDALLFVGVLIIIALVGVVYCVIIVSLRGATLGRIFFRALVILTIAVPPALPSALTIGMVFAQIRLKSLQIFCISPQRINLSGMLDIVCFDKTGTLTEDGLDLLGVQRVQDGRFELMTTSAKSLPIGPFVATMATCHSLAVVDGVLAGDPLDLKMFEATGWLFEEPDHSRGRKFTEVRPTNDVTTETNKQIAIVRQFPFSSALQRMSILANHDNQLVSYVKGSPEMIVSLSRQETVPADFQQVLRAYTQDGFRVLALAWRGLQQADLLTTEEIMKIKRDNVEKDLTFLGLMIMQNQLKPETAPALDELSRAKIRTIMITGDNLLTAINVSRKCGMCPPQDSIIHIETEAPMSSCEEDLPRLTYTPVTHGDSALKKADEMKLMDNNSPSKKKFLLERTHYALDGETFDIIQQHYQHLIDKVVAKGTVFARFSPNQKMELVEELQRLGYSVGMCGDGANDCGALKAAHAGISLSEAEASVASPFTSKVANISCVPTIIKEGRAALVTSFGLFKFVGMYGLIQFASIMVLYYIASTLTDLQFHFIDLALCTVTILLVSRGEAHPEISIKKPLTKLMTTPIIFSIVTQVIVVFLVQIAVFKLVRIMKWYVPSEFVPDGKNDVTFESTSIFLISCYQYIVFAIVYTPGKPFRKPIYSLRFYCFALIMMFVGTTLFLYVPTTKTVELMKFVVIPDNIFKTSILGLGILNLVLACIIEYLLITSDSFMRFVSCASCRKAKPPKYQTLLGADEGFTDNNYRSDAV